MKRLIVVTLFLSLLMSNAVFAASPYFRKVGNETFGESILLDESQTSSVGRSGPSTRGEYFSTGILELQNVGNGDIYILVETLAYQHVDAIYHTVFLDQWNGSRWVQIESWEFGITKEEVDDGQLSDATDTITLSGYETNKYYRARGLHVVQYNGISEGCSTQTDGVLITDH